MPLGKIIIIKNALTISLNSLMVSFWKISARRRTTERGKRKERGIKRGKEKCRKNHTEARKIERKIRQKEKKEKKERKERN